MIDNRLTLPSAKDIFLAAFYTCTAGGTMAKTCAICGKHPQSGRTISHAHNVNPRIYYPNLRTIRRVKDGTPERIKVCMKCLKAMAKT
ncbi:MAG: 50S ribosomal protein L28 [Chitinispirillaceae bacterium]